MLYPRDRPAKRKRATLESDAPRDNRMRWRRISVRGSLRAPRLPSQRISGAIPHALQTPAVRGQSPRLQTDILPEQLADIIAEQ